MSAPITPRPEAPKPEEVQAQYGFVIKLAQAIPEIAALLQRATNEKWTADRFSMAVADTNWWKTTPADTRQWVTQQISDPASAARAMKTGGDMVDLMANQLGFSGVDRARLELIWLNAKLSGYNEEMTKAYVWNDLTKYGGAPGVTPTGGEFGARSIQFRQLAAAYGYDPTDQDIFTEVGASLSGGQSGESMFANWKNRLINYAAAKYSPFADRIKAGETVMDIAKPYQDIYRQTLEIDPSGLDDPLIQKVLQGTPQEPGKPPTTAPVWQFAEQLRQDPRWGSTDNAINAAAKAATTIGKAFGMIG